MMRGMGHSDMDSQEMRLSESCIKNLKEPKNWSDWGITVAKVLRDYMLLIGQQNEGYMDFAEAAVVVQNSTCFYSKRVDEVYKIVAGLLTSITRVDDKTDEGQTKKRRVVKPLEATDLEELGDVATDHNIKVNSERLGRRNNLEVTFLNTNISEPRKPNSYCAIHQSDGQSICTKDKFRTLGYISSQAFIDDLTFSNRELNRATDLNHIDEDVYDFDECRAGDSMGETIFEPMEIEPPHEPTEQTLLPPNVSTGIGENETLGRVSPEPPEPAKINLDRLNVQPVVRLKKIIDWEEIDFNFKFPRRIIKIRDVFVLPQEILDERKEKDRKRKRKKKLEKNNNKTTEAAWLDLALQKGANSVSNPVEGQAIAEAKKRRELLQDIIKEALPGHQCGAEDPLMEAPQDDDMDCNGHDDFIFGSGEPVALGGESLLVPDADERVEDAAANGSIFASEAAQNLMRNFRDRKEMACKAAEVAKKVAVWQESILPKLKIAESRTKFDVKEYSQRILDKFPDNVGDTFFPLEHFLKGQPKHEIGRYFLSTLVMANTYNVEIRKSSLDPLATDCLEVKLLAENRRLSQNFGADEEV